MQFQPEVTPNILRTWVEAFRHKRDAEHVEPDVLLRDTDLVAAETRAQVPCLLELRRRATDPRRRRDAQ